MNNKTKKKQIYLHIFTMYLSFRLVIRLNVNLVFDVTIFLVKKKVSSLLICVRDSRHWDSVDWTGPNPSMEIQSTTFWSNRIVATVIFRLPTERVCNLLLNILLIWPMVTNNKNNSTQSFNSLTNQRILFYSYRIVHSVKVLRHIYFSSFRFI